MASSAGAVELVDARSRETEVDASRLVSRALIFRTRLVCSEAGERLRERRRRYDVYSRKLGRSCGSTFAPDQLSIECYRFQNT